MQSELEVLKHTARWDQILSQPAVNTHSGDQTATVQGGVLNVPEGYTVKFLYSNPHPTPEEWDGQTKIVGVEVYKQTGDMVFAYKPMNPGQTASIQTDLSGLGDCYIRIDLSVMLSNDPGAPRLGQVLLTNGTNSFLELPKTFPRGDGAFNLTGPCQPCLLTGTMISMGDHLVPVETLKPGMMVETLNGLKELVGVYARHYSAQEVAANPKLLPFRYTARPIIEAHMPNASAPVDMSRQHRVVVDTDQGPRLASAVHLSKVRPDTCFEMTDWDGPVVYYALVFEQHEIVLAGVGMVPVESTWLGGEMAKDVLGPHWDEVKHLLPNHQEPALPICKVKNKTFV